MITDLQCRFDIGEGELEGFGVNGLTFKITGVSNERDLIKAGGSPFWQKMQYTAQTDDGTEYEVYVYYYNSFEGSRYAVVDAYRLA